MIVDGLCLVLLLVSSVFSIHRLFAQLTTDDSDEMTEKAKESIEGQITELRKVAAKRLVLVVLDGLCSACLRFVMFRSFLFFRHVGRRA